MDAAWLLLDEDARPSLPHQPSMNPRQTRTVPVRPPDRDPPPGGRLGGERPPAAAAVRRRQRTRRRPTGWWRWPGPPGPVDAVLAFTAHHVVAAGVDPDLVAARLPEGDLSAPMGRASSPGSASSWAAGRAASTWSWPPRAWAARRWSCAPGRSRAAPAGRQSLRYRDRLEVWTAPDDAGVLVLGQGPAAGRSRSRSTRPGATAARPAPGRGRPLPDPPRRAAVRPGRPRQRRLPAGGRGGRLPPPRRRGPVPPGPRRPT